MSIHHIVRSARLSTIYVSALAGQNLVTFRVVKNSSFKANLHMPCSAHTVPLPCRAALIHMPCRAPSILRLCCVLRERPRGSRKYPNCLSYKLTYWYAYDKNLCGTPRDRQKKSNVGRSPTCRIWTADANSHMSCHAHAALCRDLKVVFRTAWSWHGTGAA
jgi:hypothetical protein